MLLIYVGQKLFKYREQSLHSPFLALASLIILLMYTFTIGNVNSSHLIGMIVNAYPDVATLFVGTVCGLFLVSYIGCKLSNTKLGAVLALCGRESFYIMALHMFFYRLIVRLFNPWLHVYVDSEGSFFPSFLTFWVLFIGSISLTLACVFLCRKVYRHICVKK